MGRNDETIRSLYDAFARGDVAAVLGSMDPDVDWQEPESMPLESQRGPDAVAEHIFGALLAQLDDLRVDAREVHEAGDVVFSVGTYSGVGKQTGVTLDAGFVHVWRFGGDGRITGFRTYTDTHRWRLALGAA